MENSTIQQLVSADVKTLKAQLKALKKQTGVTKNAQEEHDELKALFDVLNSDLDLPSKLNTDAFYGYVSIQERIHKLQKQAFIEALINQRTIEAELLGNPISYSACDCP